MEVNRSLFVYNSDFTNSLTDTIELNFLLPASKVRCFNHSSIIQNFFDNAVINHSFKPNEISHNRDVQAMAKGMIKDKHTLFDYADLDNVLQAFRSWKQKCYLHPFVLHSHGQFDNGEEISATWQGLNRFQTDRNIKPLSKALENYHGKGVFLTLTVDHKIVTSLKDAWQNISKQWNIFMTRLSKELNIPRKDIHYLWVLEAQGNGYPHIHALFLGIDYLFWAGNKQEWINDNPHSKNLKHFWNWGSVFVNSTKSSAGVKNPVSYMMKYIRKTFTPYSDDDKKELTQSLLWAFNKRSWNTSRGLLSYLGYSPKVPVVDLYLEEMVSFSRLKGQSSGVVWVDSIDPELYPEAVKPLDVLTTSDEDLNYLAEKVSLFRATSQEQRALKYLLDCRAKNKVSRWVVTLPSPKNDLYRFWRHKRGV